MVEVTQADREAAADLYLALDGDLPTHEITEEADRHRRGDRDHTAPVQAFARHRIAERERNAGKCEHLSRKTGSELVGQAFMRAAQAIREQSNGA